MVHRFLTANRLGWFSVVFVVLAFQIIVPSLCSECDQQQQVFSFGLNGYGQLGDGTNTTRKIPVAVDSSGILNGKSIIAISGGLHSLVLSCESEYWLKMFETLFRTLKFFVLFCFVFPPPHKATGQVFGFGYNEFGQLGEGTNTNRLLPVAVDTSGVLNGKTITDISAGAYHSLVLSCEI